ncbi:hypothetical protein EOM71_00835 [Candidatus Falkowbacteria bacterium]|nr:hypothetical protein [Candidatus Falkowbacteria bacterium]
MPANLQNAFSGSQLNETAIAAGYDPTQNNALTTVSSFITIVLGLVGVIFLALIIYGGFLWMTAAGNEKQVETAKSIISRAAIGLIIIVLAYAITFFIIKLLS